MMIERQLLTHIALRETRIYKIACRRVRITNTEIRVADNCCIPTFVYTHVMTVPKTPTPLIKKKKGHKKEKYKFSTIVGTQKTRYRRPGIIVMFHFSRLLTRPRCPLVHALCALGDEIGQR